MFSSILHDIYFNEFISFHLLTAYYMSDILLDIAVNKTEKILTLSTSHSHSD